MTPTRSIASNRGTISWMSGLVIAGVVAVIAVAAAEAQVTTRTDTQYGSSPTLNGAIGTNEYGVGNAYNYNGGGNGFGGAVGNGTFWMTSDASNLYVAFQNGGTFNDFAIVYLDAQTGGFNDSTMNDTADAGRRAVTGLGEPGTDGFPFLADYALLLHSGGCTLFSLNSGSLGVVTISSGPTCASGNGSGVVREVSIPLSSIGATGGARNVDFFVA